MKSCIAFLAALLASPTLCAHGGIACGFLNISILNTTSSSCTLQSSTIFNGSLHNSSIPSTIASGTMTAPFSIEQSFTAGPGILLNYKCGNNSISFVSEQGLCLFSTGAISGIVESSNGMQATFTTTPGSHSGGLPGSITWTLTS